MAPLQAGLQRLNEHLQSVVEGKLLRVLFGNLAAAFARARAQDLPQEQRTIALLQRDAVWERPAGPRAVSGCRHKLRPPTDQWRNPEIPGPAAAAQIARWILPRLPRAASDERLGQNPQLGRRAKTAAWSENRPRKSELPPAFCRAPRSAFPRPDRNKAGAIPVPGRAPDRK